MWLYFRTYGRNARKEHSWENTVRAPRCISAYTWVRLDVTALLLLLLLLSLDSQCDSSIFAS